MLQESACPAPRPAPLTCRPLLPPTPRPGPQLTQLTQRGSEALWREPWGRREPNPQQLLSLVLPVLRPVFYLFPGHPSSECLFLDQSRHDTSVHVPARLQAGPGPAPGTQQAPGAERGPTSAAGLMGRFWRNLLGLNPCWRPVRAWTRSSGPQFPPTSPQPSARVGCPIHALHSTRVLPQGPEGPAVSGPGLRWRVRSFWKNRDPISRDFQSSCWCTSVCSGKLPASARLHLTVLSGEPFSLPLAWQQHRTGSPRPGALGCAWPAKQECKEPALRAWNLRLNGAQQLRDGDMDQAHGTCLKLGPFLKGAPEAFSQPWVGATPPPFKEVGIPGPSCCPSPSSCRRPRTFPFAWP